MALNLTRLQFDKGEVVQLLEGIIEKNIKMTDRARGEA